MKKVIGWTLAAGVAVALATMTMLWARGAATAPATRGADGERRIVPAAQDIKGEGEWGEASEGVKARLTADAKTGVLKVEARNDGEREFLHVGATEHSLELEVDGKWYRWAAAKDLDMLLAFGPGAQLKDVTVTWTGDWEEKKDGDVYVRAAGWVDTGKRPPLELKEGKHKVRVAVYGVPSRANTGGLIRAVSNAVEVEVGVATKPAATKPAATEPRG